MSNPEQTATDLNTLNSLELAAERSYTHLRNSPEKERHPEAQAERASEALANARKEALMSREKGGTESKKSQEPVYIGPRRNQKQQKEATYKKTLFEIRSNMNQSERAFSKIIHEPVIEKTSETIANTVARPNAILSGAIAALVIVSVAYGIAKTYGYQLSGFESIGSFIIGWMIGLAYDYARIMIRGTTK